MNYKNVLVSLVLLFMVSMTLVSSLTESNEIRLTKGKNLVNLNLTNPVYVNDLLALNPEIEVVSYRHQNKTVGYVNYLGGMGANFIVTGGEYEIIVKSDITLLFPE